MRRRGFLGVLGVSALAGCSQITGFLEDREIGDSATFGEVEVTVTDAMTANAITLTRMGESETIESPPNGVFALFYIEAHNSDVTDRKGPGVNLISYDVMTEGENEIRVSGVNDIRVHGSGEGGYLPDEFRLGSLGYEEIGVNDASLPAYPASTTGTRPSIPPDGTIEGWMFGIIKSDTTPQVKVEYKNKSAMWTAESVSLDTPTPSQNTTVSF